MGILTTDRAARKDQPIATGVLGYFPNAIAEVANVSVVGNRQHNPGEPLHWAREKSDDHADSAVRHLIERGTVDVDGVRHTAKAAWRILALLQTEIEQEAVNEVAVEGPPPIPHARVAEADLDETADLTFDKDDDRTPVFVTGSECNLGPRYYFVSDSGDIHFVNAAADIASAVKRSWSYDDLEAVYDAVEAGRLIEVNNANDGNSYDGSDPLPGFDSNDTVELTPEGDSIAEQLAKARYNNQTDLSEEGGA